MKRNILLGTFILFVTTILYHCTPKSNLTTQKPVEMGEINPNKSSELAELMREMDKDSWKIREAIEKNQNIPDIKDKFAKLHTAEATEPEKKNEAYKVMGDNFLASLDKIYQTNNKEEKIESYNMMVNNCLNCHKSVCPGPMVRIKKLFLKP
jgi:seryl-tRNA synthetase